MIIFGCRICTTQIVNQFISYYINHSTILAEAPTESGFQTNIFATELKIESKICIYCANKVILNTGLAFTIVLAVMKMKISTIFLSWKIRFLYLVTVGPTQIQVKLVSLFFKLTFKQIGFNCDRFVCVVVSSRCFPQPVANLINILRS